VRDLFVNRPAFDDWASGYEARRQQQDSAASTRLMLATNPKFILRNHLGEQAIRAAKARDYAEVNKLLTVLQSPFDEHEDVADHAALAGFPPDWASGIEISCSS
jgi:uncharacterized protein YdiU (UPF0061 family)